MVTLGIFGTCAGSDTGLLQMFAVLVVIVEGVHGLLVLPVHPAFFAETHTHSRTLAATT